MTNFELVKSLTDLPSLMEEAGLAINRGGFCKCFLHEDRTPSLKIYPDQGRWWCFSCNRGGDVFDFCECFYKLDTKSALSFLAQKAGLNIIGKPIAPEIRREIEEKRQRREREKMFKQWVKSETLKLAGLLYKLDIMIDKITPKSLGFEWSRFLMESREIFEYHYEILLGHDWEAKLELYERAIDG
ncbi:MAG: hypothetical protein JW984_16190 [Deltaproteobacteria bacterium]|uniref:Zinc finger CHC2-type domain-containing protein n=1 Tax=Candidatus Zymogenus saltonus TaxID=2844893 RepID=A0A9D8KJQ2_9DELT|nr:hypothetical protein [Candidatus Zymogenus saltonus]